MDPLWIILIGCPIGVIARLLNPARGEMGLLACVLLGIGGAFLGGHGGQVLGLYRATQAPGLIACVAGAIALLALVRRRLAPKRRQLQTTANT